MQESTAALIRRRYSCRTYLDQPIDGASQEALRRVLDGARPGPLGTRARLALIAATPGDRASLRGLGTYGFIKGATGFIAGAAERAPRDLEDFGFLMEHAVLSATGLGLGTCWLGGTFARSRFAGAIDLRPGEIMPAVIATGVIAPGAHARDWVRRQARGADRLPFERLVFDGGFDRPLPPAAAGRHGAALEAVRWAPSASNRQPWRVVRSGADFHFYLSRTKGYGKGSLLFRVLRLPDLQRVDLGIAMCHFELVSRECDLPGRWLSRDPGLAGPGGGAEYIATWTS